MTKDSMRLCAHCTRPFARGGTRQKYCCRQCAHRAWYVQNREYVSALTKARYLKNKDHILEQTRKWRAENQERVAEWRRQYIAKRREHRREYNRKYRIKNRERLNEANRKFYAKHRQRILESRAKDGDRLRARDRAWERQRAALILMAKQLLNPQQEVIHD